MRVIADSWADMNAIPARLEISESADREWDIKFDDKDKSIPKNDKGKVLLSDSIDDMLKLAWTWVLIAGAEVLPS